MKRTYREDEGGVEKATRRTEGRYGRLREAPIHLVSLRHNCTTLMFTNETASHTRCDALQGKIGIYEEKGILVQ